MKSKLIVIGILTCLAAFTQAASITQTWTIGQFVPDGTYQSSGAAYFGYFDTLGGTRVLESVTIRSTLVTWGGSFGVDNDSAIATSGDAAYGTDVSISSFDVRLGGATTALSALTSLHVNLGATFGGPTDPAGVWNDTGHSDSTLVYGPVDRAAGEARVGATFIDTGVQTLTHPEDFIGWGTYNIQFAATGHESFSGGEVSQEYGSRYAGGSVEIVYNYTVPEPTSAGLALLGLAAFGLRRRRD